MNHLILSNLLEYCHLDKSVIHSIYVLYTDTYLYEGYRQEPIYIYHKSQYIYFSTELCETWAIQPSTRVQPTRGNDDIANRRTHDHKYMLHKHRVRITRGEYKQLHRDEEHGG